jgi:TP901 family phage tail tape measure protein
MADSDFERLLKTVSQLNANLTITKTLLGDLSAKVVTSGNSPLTAMVSQMEKDVTRLEGLKTRAAAAVLSEVRTTKLASERGAPLGRIPGESKYSYSPANTLDTRTSEAKIMQDARNIAKTVLSQQKALLDAAKIQANAIREYDNYIRGVPASGGAISNSSRQPFYIPTPGAGIAGRISAAQEAIVNRNLQAQIRAKASQMQSEVSPVTDLVNSIRGSIPAFTGSESFVSNKNAALLLEQERLVASLRHRISSETKYTQALEQAAAQGFNVNDLKRVQSRGTSGIEQLQFQKTDPSGINRRFDTFVNPQGRATPGISNQFRSFGQGVVRDIGELTKWSIALAAVYGPMRKLQELTQIMIANEVKLAEATISVSSAFVDQGQIFDTAAKAANDAGESVSGVIDAFTQAYRATGGTANEVERYATATTLLNNSLTLSKLSTLDQAGAIDTLSAALRQTGKGLGDGVSLLDKWVRVTKVANVDLATLATGFAVVGDAAEASGISVDQLNGLIAAIAETGISSGRETANVARAIVSGFQSESAKAALENLGIAGDDFLTTMKQIYNLRDQKIISDEQFSKLTLALGGGTRRQAAYSTFIENFDRVFSIAEESSKASGDAQAALEKQLGTVQTSLDRLGNAFQTLAQTMGTEGGFLSIIKGSVNGMAALVKAFDTLVGLLGKATPAMAAFIATTLILKSRGTPSIQSALGGVGTGLLTTPLDARLVAAGQGQSRGVLSAGQRANNFIGTNVLGSNAASGISQGIALAAIPALQNLFNKDDKYGKTKAGADVVGGVAGGIIGALVAGSPLIGSAIGIAISEAFVNSTIARDVDVFGFGKKATLGTSFALDTSTDKTAALNAAVSEIYKSIGFGNENFGKLISSGAEKTGKNLTERINEAIKSQNPEELRRALTLQSAEGTAKPATDQELRNLGLSTELINQAFKEGKPIEYAPETAAYNRAGPEARRQYDIAKAQYDATQGLGAEIGQEFVDRVAQNNKLFQPIIENVKKTAEGTISGERLSGDLKGTQYTGQIKSLEGFNLKSLQYYTAFGKEFEKINKDIKTSSDLFQAFSDITVYGSQESVAELTKITNEIAVLINALNDPTLKGQETFELPGIGTLTRVQAEERLASNVNLGATLATDVRQQAGLSRLNIPQVQGDLNKPITTPELQQVSQLAIQLQEKFYKGFLDIPDQLYDGLKESWDEWAQIVRDSGDAFFEKIEGIDPQFFQQAMQKLMEEGKIKSQKETPYGIQQIDLPGSKAGELNSMVSYFTNYLSQKFPQYKQNPEEIGVIFNDYVTGTLHGDNLAIKLALDKLVDLNQKQLDGMYNIPEGATFWVPLQAAYYRNKGGGEGGLPSVETAANTSATELNTQALLTLNTGRMSRQKELFLEEGGTGSGYKAYGAGYITPTGVSKYSGGIGSGYIPGAPSQPGPSGKTTEGTFLDKLYQFLTPAMKPPGLEGGIKSGMLGASGAQNFRNISAAQPSNTPVNTRLEMKIDNNTQLVVDGKILASILSPFLATELLRLEASQGTISRRYVI